MRTPMIAVLAASAVLSGCATMQQAAETPPITQAVLFDSGKAVVKAEYVTALTGLVGQMACKDGYSVVVEGHTDNVGNESYNSALSEKRAGAVRDVIVAQGVPSDHVTTAGFGEAAPVAPNEDNTSRSQNRRVNVIASQMDGGCAAAMSDEVDTAGSPSEGVPKYLYRNHGQEGNG